MNTLTLPALRLWLNRRPDRQRALDRHRADAADETLMTWTAAGDRLAFDELVARHLNGVHGLALRIVRNASLADDVVQELFLRAWLQAGRFDPARGRLVSWLNRMAINIAIDVLRSLRTNEPIESAFEVPDAGAGPEESLITARKREAVSAAVASLPLRQRAAVALVYDQDLSGEQAAAALNVSVRALEGLLRRARRMLCNRLRGRS